MSIKNITISGIGQEGTAIRRNSMISYDDLSTITTAGYLNEYADQILSSDQFDVYYDWDDTTNTGTFATFTVSIGTDGITLVDIPSTDIPPNTITTAMIQNGAITTAKLATVPEAVTTATIRDANVTTVKIADQNVTYGKIQLVSALSVLGRSASSGGPVGEITSGAGGQVLLNNGLGSLAFGTLTTASYGNGSVTLLALSAGITPAYIAKLGDKFSEAGGSATVNITATGVVATDNVQCVIESSANAVSIQKVTPGTDTITVLCSGDPGASIFSWMAFRAAS